MRAASLALALLQLATAPLHHDPIDGVVKHPDVKLKRLVFEYDTMNVEAPQGESIL